MRLPTFLLIALVLPACAKGREAPLPGDSVASDGAVMLSPPKLVTAPKEDAPRDKLGPIESRLFPPELVMEHQAELAVTPEQRKILLAETERGQSEMLRLQWELTAEKEKLVALLDGDRADEAKVRDQAARVVDRENKVKGTHLAMLVRVKNSLTPEQLAKLRTIRPRECR